MTRLNKILIALLILLVVAVSFLFYFKSKYEENITMNVPEAGYKLDIPKNISGANEVAVILTNKGLVDDLTYTKLWIRLHKSDTNLVNSGLYDLEPGMTLDDLFKLLRTSKERKQISFQVREGLTLKKFAHAMAKQMLPVNSSAEEIEKTQNEILNYWSQKDILDQLISNYDFIDDKILNEEIFYPLEGYLSPNTYFFFENDFKIEKIDLITKKLIDQREKDFDVIFADGAEFSEYLPDYHSLLTLASIVEREAKGYEDKKIVAGIFINRIKSGDRLGSDVTTYYAEQIDLDERDLKVSELNEKNAYNTRGPLIGLPVGPINNPSKQTIDATINYTESDYYYFVSDKNGKMYYNKTYQQHLNEVKRLKAEGLWFTYE